MRTSKVEGIVLKRRDVGEADRLITLFTSSQGKLTVLAKGIRRTTSRRAGPMELFNHITATIHASPTSYPVLGEVEIINSYSAWRHHLGRITVAYQLAETIDKLTPDNQPHPEVFSMLLKYLAGISKLGESWKSTVDTWLLGIVRHLGYWPPEEPFIGDIYQFIEELADKPLYSPDFIHKLKRPV